METVDPMPPHLGGYSALSMAICMVHPKPLSWDIPLESIDDEGTEIQRIKSLYLFGRPWMKINPIQFDLAQNSDPTDQVKQVACLFQHSRHWYGRQILGD